MENTFTKALTSEKEMRIKTIRIKAYKYWGILSFALVIFACSKDDNEISEANFNILGINSITINDQSYTVKDNLLLELGDSQNIVMSGVQMTESTKHAVIEYSVIPAMEEPPEISAISRYKDVAISCNSMTTTNSQTCVILDICRNGNPEQVTYKFYFLNI